MPHRPRHHHPLRRRLRTRINLSSVHPRPRMHHLYPRPAVSPPEASPSSDSSGQDVFVLAGLLDRRLSATSSPFVPASSSIIIVFGRLFILGDFVVYAVLDSRRCRAMPSSFSPFSACAASSSSVAALASSSSASADSTAPASSSSAAFGTRSVILSPVESCEPARHSAQYDGHARHADLDHSLLARSWDDPSVGLRCHWSRTASTRY